MPTPKPKSHIDEMPADTCLTYCVESLFLQRTRKLFPQVLFSVAFRQMLESLTLFTRNIPTVSVFSPFHTEISQ